MNTDRKLRIALLLLCVSFVALEALRAQPYNCSYMRQGFSMKVMLNNMGIIGRVANAFCNAPEPLDSIGLEYPLGSNIEHLTFGGLWIGGILDTAMVGTSTPLRVVSVSYEGWSGPLYEFFPGNTPADTFWKANVGLPMPQGWDEYWGGALPYDPMSDQDLHCTYTDTVRSPQGHVPMRLKVIQSTYAWNDSAQRPIVIMEYRLMNNGYKTIDSLSMGFMVEPHEWITVPTLWTQHYTMYDEDLFLAFSQSAHYPSSTPVGLSLLAAPRPRDSLRMTFRYFPGQDTPSSDVMKYEMLSSGVIDPPEYPNTSDSRFVLACGPFTLRSAMHESPDTLTLAFALVSGQNTEEMKANAVHAGQLYQEMMERRRTRAVSR